MTEVASWASLARSSSTSRLKIGADEDGCDSHSRAADIRRAVQAEEDAEKVIVM